MLDLNMDVSDCIFLFLLCFHYSQTTHNTQHTVDSHLPGIASDYTRAPAAPPNSDYSQMNDSPARVRSTFYFLL